MFAAGGLALEFGLVLAGVVVVLGTMWFTSRSRAPKDPTAATPAPPPAVAPPTRRVAGPEPRSLGRAPVVRPVLVRRPTGEQRTFALDVSTGGLLVAGPSD